VLLGGSSSVWKWSGSWSSLGALPREPGVLQALSASGLVATCPQFVQVFPPIGMWVDQLYQWHGSAWSLLGPQFRGLVTCMVGMPNGDLVVAGSFTALGTTAMTRIARWDGSAWLPLGNGFLDGGVDQLAVAPNGDLVAVGSFTAAGGSPGNHVARWDG